jgi:hypothetical protein
MTMTARVGKRLGRVEGCDPIGAEHSDELAGQPARSASDIEGALSSAHPGSLDQRTPKLRP